MNIYAISDQSGNVKIGISKGSPAARADALQTGNASKLSLIGYGSHEKAGDLEYQLHQELKSAGLHLRGEWFAPSIFTTCIANALSVDLLEEACEVAIVAAGKNPWTGKKEERPIYHAMIFGDQLCPSCRADISSSKPIDPSRFDEIQREYMRKRRATQHPKNS